MTTANLGTCCGSQPKVGLAPWLKAGGRGIDTAYDYGKQIPGGDQTDIRKVLGAAAVPRDQLFITSKIPAGAGNRSDCAEDPNTAVRYAQENLKELGVDYLDLLLLHAPCWTTAANAALWKGMAQALAMNLTRAIGVSNYGVRQLQALPAPKPAVNQCGMSVRHRDDATIAYCHEKGIVYEAYGAMGGCPFTDSRITSIAAAHKKTPAQVCLRYILEKGVVIAVGTGSDPEKSAREAVENLDIYDFAFSYEEFRTVDAIQRDGELSGPRGDHPPNFGEPLQTSSRQRPEHATLV